MERLVKRWGNNHAVPSKFNLDFVFDMDNEAYKGLVEIFDRLDEYESTGFSPADIERVKYPAEAALKFAYALQGYREAEIEGRLAILPCKPGDTVYVNKKCFSDWYCFMEFKPYVRAEVVNFKFTKDGIKMNIRPLTKRAAGTRYHRFFPLSAIGKTVFLLEEEAEAVLKGVRG